MSTITTRAGKGSPLTNNEVDANFTNLNNDKLESADLSGYAELTGATFTGEVEATGFNGDLTGAILFKGQAGEALTKGDPVYISGISGNKTVVSKADANDSNKMPCFGIVDATVSANADCSVVTFGTLQGLDTSSFSEGDELFVSDTGALTTTAPTGESSQIQKIGKVTRSHASAGSIKVMGAGRTNAVPNLNDGQFFLGNGSNQAVSADFTTSVLGEISAGTGIGISASGVISNTSPDQTVVLTGAGATSISGTYPNFTISSTDSNTTYTAGSGITLTGTTFSLTDKANYDAAYGWGDHSTAGYLTSHQSLSGYATETYVGTQITNLVDSAPATMDTLNELAAALGDDPNFATTVSTSIGTKLPLAGGTLTGALSGTTATFSGNLNAESDIRVGTAAGATNQTGIIKENGSAYGLGLFTWGDTAPVQIGGGSLNLQKEAGGGVDLKIAGTTVIDSSRNITTTGNIARTGTEGREIQTYMASSYTTNDIVAGHEYGWYSDYWRIGISRSGNHLGEAFRFNYSGSYVAQIGTTGIFDGTGYRVSGTTVIDSSRNLLASGLASIEIGDTTTATIDNQTDYSNPLIVERSSNSGKGAIVIRGSDTIGTAIEQGRTDPASHWGTYLDFLVHDNNTTDLTGFTRRMKVDADGVQVYGGIKISGTTVIDSSRNLTNIGTISSGAITSTGASSLLGDKFRLSEPVSGATLVRGFSDEYHGMLFRGRPTSSSSYGSADVVSFFEYGGVFEFYKRNPTTYTKLVDFNASGIVNAIGGYSVNGTTVIDSSRNLTNIGTISSGAISINGIDQSIVVQHDLPSSSGSWAGRIISKNASTNVASFLGNYKGYAGVFAHNSALNAWAPIYINAHSGSGQANVYTGSLYVNGNNLAWHAGNDGSGSGLDADLLDGQHGSYYYSAGNPAPNQTITLSGAVTGSGTTSITTSNPYQTSVTFATNGPDSAMEYQQASGITDTKKAPSSDWYNSIRMGHGDPYSYYSNTIAVKMTGGSEGTLYTQSILNNNANGWKKHWNDSNDGSGSGLDADTVDGKHKDYLMHYKGIVSGNWDTIFSQTAGHMGVYQVENISNTDSNYPSGAYTYGGVMSWQLANSTFKLYAPHVGQLFYQTGWNNDEYSGWRKIWDTGNDGSGSGLDADLLDGYNTSTSATANTVVVREGSGHIYGNYIIGSYLNASSGNNENPTIGQVWTQSTGDNYLRKSTPAHFKSQLGLWHTGNDGSGSCLDADTLRGTSGDNYFRKDIEQTVSANILFANSTTAKRGISGTMSDNDQWFVGGAGTGSNAGYLEISTGDDGQTSGSAEYIYVRQYGPGSPLTGTLTRTAALLDNYGNTYFPGNVTAYYSDERLKTKTGNITNAIEKVQSLSGFYYVENELAKQHGYSTETQQVGLSAQEVKAVLPEAVSLAPFDRIADEVTNDSVSKSGEEYLTVDYSRLVPLLIESIKELKSEVDDLKTQLETK